MIHVLAPTYAITRLKLFYLLNMIIIIINFNKKKNLQKYDSIDSHVSYGMGIGLNVPVSGIVSTPLHRRETYHISAGFYWSCS